MGDHFKVQVFCSTARLAAVATPLIVGCTRFFSGWTTRLGNPPYLFTFPLSERAPEPPWSNHPQIIEERANMFTAYVLINTEIGSESAVLEALKKIEGVEEAHNLWGVYDIIASIKADTLDRLKFIITKKLENIGKVNAKLTMIATEPQMPSAQSDEILLGTPALQSS